MKLNPQGIRGTWAAGMVLDWHTVRSQCIGYNEFDHPIFETTRTEIGELLHRFKYHGDQSAGEELTRVACDYLSQNRGKFDVVIPIPPSKSDRTVTSQIAQSIAACVNAQYIEDGIRKTKHTEELKSVDNPERRKEILINAFAVTPGQMFGKTILLVDDLYDTGTTLEEATNVVYKQGLAAAVYAFAITRTGGTR